MLTQEDYWMIKELHDQGIYQKDMAYRLGVNPKTVSRALARGGPPSRKRQRPKFSKLEPYMAKVDELLGAGVWNAEVIYQELLALGYTGKARLPRVKTLEQFDFSFQPSIDQKVVRELATLGFVGHTENVVLLGPPGVGKSHLAIALAVKAAEAGHRILFLTLEQLMAKLTRAQQENRLERQLQQLTYPKVLVLDEIGYLPLSHEDASLFFRLVARRYEKAPIVLTSNKSFVDWGEIFGDPVLATAILDRLLHHATTINIKGESYRLKEKRKAGLLNQAKPQEETAQTG